jgi:LysM repeat protein
MDIDNEQEDIQQGTTGGLGLMTVFIVVFSLHVLVIGGISAYHYLTHNESSEEVAAEVSSTAGTADIASASGHRSVEDDMAMPEPETPSSRLSVPTDPHIVSPRDMYSMRLPTPVTESQAESSAQVPHEGPASAAEQAGGAMYTAVKGDNFWKIARRFNTKAELIMSANGITDPSKLKIGQQLKIPGATAISIATAAAATPPATKAVPSATAPAAPAAKAAPAETSLASNTTIRPATAATSGDEPVIYGDDVPTAPRAASAPDPVPARATASTATTVAATTTAVHRAAPAPGSAKTAPARGASGGQMYKVEKGDTLWRIAKKFNTTADALMSANGISDPSKLKIGAELRIPHSRSRSSSSTQQADSAPQPRAPAPAPAAPATAVVLNNVN